jgi:hypothetical protein
MTRYEPRKLRGSRKVNPIGGSAVLALGARGVNNGLFVVCAVEP